MTDTNMLGSQERLRYSRHLILPEVGLVGQLRLAEAKVAVIGAGGLGSPVILYLAAAGVGSIGVIDFDSVDLSNLQRQVIYTVEDVDKPKATTAVKRAGELNPHVRFCEHAEKLSADNVLRILERYDLVVDGTDNFTTRYLVNDACVLMGKPNVYGSIYRFEGQASVFGLAGGPCYRCLFPYPPQAEAVPNCAEGGVLGVVAGLIGVIQATEAVKIILNTGDTLAGRLLLYDALTMTFDTLELKRNLDCPVCGDKPTIKTVAESAFSCAAETGSKGPFKEIRASDLKGALDAGQKIFLLDVRNKEEYELCHLPHSVLIPLPQLQERLAEIERDAEIVVYCKSGNRSKKAIEILADSGFSRLRNLTGGIIGWAKEVDPAMVSY